VVSGRVLIFRITCMKNIPLLAHFFVASAWNSVEKIINALVRNNLVNSPDTE